MAIVQITSDNPQFTFLLRKNPRTGMQLRQIRQGMAYGWYSDEATFNVFFRDADNEVSYKRHAAESFEYLNVSRYNTPLFPLAAIGEFFASPFKARSDRDKEGYEHRFHIDLIHIDRVRYVDFFAKHLKDCGFVLEHRAHKSYALTITTCRSLYHLLHVAAVLCLFLAMFGNEYLDLSDSLLDKYVRSLNIIDAPFYIRSLFARSFMTSRERFAKYREEIERTDRYEIRLEYGGTALQRRNYIAGQLAFDKPIVDVGCGEGYYALAFAGKITETYYAIDVSDEALAAVNRKAEAREIDNIVTYAALEHFLEMYNGETVDVIMTEVIEHMDKTEAAALIGRICGQVAFDRLAVTTPNADFNRYYELEGFRHEDHKWEMGESEFRQWFAEAVRDYPVTYEFAAIGDRVDGIHTTQGVIARKGEK